ncbi:MAG: glycine betaine ABC transporter substrate-binding protein [Acholeplasmataceae bacterium]
MKRIHVSLLLALFASVLALASCEAQGAQQKQVVLASKPMTEQLILAEMITLLIETNSDISVEHLPGIGGGTANIHPAMVEGEIDIYPEYTGTGWMQVLKEDYIADPEELYQSVKESYDRTYSITWLDLYGFNNTFGLAIRRELAEDLNISTYSDLLEHDDDLTFGANYDFYEREDGYPGLQETYGIDFDELVELEIGLKYQAIDEKEIDVTNIFTTDGRLEDYDLVVLEDDRAFFPSYYATTLIRNETLEEHPELFDILNVLGGQISDDEMIHLNHLVETDRLDPKEVAEDFLTEKGLLD